MRKLPLKAQIFVVTTWLFGAAAAAAAVLAPGPVAEVPGWELGLFVLFGLVAGGAKVPLMRHANQEDQGSITLGFLFTFAALLRFGPPGAVLVGVTSMLSASVFPRPLPLHQLTFNTALVAVSAYVAGVVFLLANGGTHSLEPLISLPAVVAASLSFFLIEAGAVASVVALSTRQSALRLFKETLLWTAPSYVAVACATALAVLLLRPHVGVALLYLGPLGYLTYQTYAVYSARAEENRRHVEEMKEREERLRLALSAAHMGAWDLNLVTGQMVWYEGMAPLFGLAEDKFAGTKDAFLALIHPDDRPEMERNLAKAAEAGKLEETQFQVLRPDGCARWLSALGVAYRDAAGETVRVGGVVLDVTERKRSEDRITWQAHHDALTGLPNRVLFQNRLEQVLAIAGRTGDVAALLFLDLNRFKTINDTLGHAAGDRLLQEVANRLGQCVRSEDTVARMGGDEFTVLLPGIRNPQNAAKVAQTLLNALAVPLRIEGHELHVAASVGISLYPFDGEDAGTLLRNADAAMYRAKEEGHGSYRIYTEAMNTAAFERLVLENSLRVALDRNELLLLYQPQVDLTTGQVIGVEALVRWRHPELGLLPAGRFIPMAEETGLIIPLGEWILRQACRQASEWQAAGRPVPVAVNLSARQLGNGGLADLVESALAETGLEPRWLNLELTESAIMQHKERAAEVLRALKQRGVRISLDDFGTGYSSLAYLRYFPIDILKVDGSFVTRLAEDTTDQALVRGMIDLAHALKMEVIAEGVETAAQENRLSVLGCDAMQGYLFSPPVAAEEMQVFLHR